MQDTPLTVIVCPIFEGPLAVGMTGAAVDVDMGEEPVERLGLIEAK